MNGSFHEVVAADLLVTDANSAMISWQKFHTQALYLDHPQRNIIRSWLMNGIWNLPRDQYQRLPNYLSNAVSEYRFRTGESEAMHNTWEPPVEAKAERRQLTTVSSSQVQYEEITVGISGHTFNSGDELAAALLVQLNRLLQQFPDPETIELKLVHFKENK